MNAIQTTCNPSHPRTMFVRLLVSGLVALLLGALLALPALAAGSGTWTVTGSMNAQRYEYTATLLQNGQVLVAGGVDDFNRPRASAELYNPSTGTWTTTGSMSTARSFHTATLLPNGQVLVAGGQPTAFFGCPLDTASAELYNPATGAWSITGSLNQARDTHTATLLTNGQVLVAGGEFNDDNCGTTFLSSAELYTP